MQPILTVLSRCKCRREKSHNMKHTFNTWAPLFPGFYNTVFEADETGEIESHNSEHGTKLEYDDFVWDYTDYNERVASAFVSGLETELKQFLDVSIEYEGIQSPREYNFANDNIDIAVTLDLAELVSLIKDREELAREYFKASYTSCPGFISFHSNDLADWINEDYIMERPEHRIGALLDCLCNCEIDPNDIIYWVDSEMYINCTVKETEE